MLFVTSVLLMMRNGRVCIKIAVYNAILST